MKAKVVAVVVSAFVSGALFALGLVVAGMTQPAKIFGFLDFFGTWDPSLMWVMVGAIGVNAPLTWRILQRRAPRFESAFSLPPRARTKWTYQINVRLVLGAALFGIGWGLGGYCPGPAIVALPSGVGAGATVAAPVFTAAMVMGMVLFSLYERYRSRKLVEPARPCCAAEANRGTLTETHGSEFPGA